VRACVCVCKRGSLATFVSKYGLLGKSKSNRMQHTYRPCKVVGKKPSVLKFIRMVSTQCDTAAVVSSPSCPCPVLNVVEEWTYANSIFGPCVGQWITVSLLHHEAFPFLRIPNKRTVFLTFWNIVLFWTYPSFHPNHSWAGFACVVRYRNEPIG